MVQMIWLQTLQFFHTGVSIQTVCSHLLFLLTTSPVFSFGDSSCIPWSWHKCRCFLSDTSIAVLCLESCPLCYHVFHHFRKAELSSVPPWALLRGWSFCAWTLVFAKRRATARKERTGSLESPSENDESKSDMKLNKGSLAKQCPPILASLTRKSHLL